MAEETKESLVEVQAGGKTFLVPEAMAAVMDADRALTEERFNTAQTQHDQQIRELSTQISTKLDTVPEPVDDEEQPCIEMNARSIIGRTKYR